jgi:hypothetical protein
LRTEFAKPNSSLHDFNGTVKVGDNNSVLCCSSLSVANQISIWHPMVEEGIKRGGDVYRVDVGIKGAPTHEFALLATPKA